MSTQPAGFSTRAPQIVAAAAVAVAALATFLAFPLAAHASGILYVAGSDPNCSDAGPSAGAQTQPFCSIGAAAAVAGPGATVQVAAGTYNEQVNPGSGTSGAPLVFTAAPGAFVTVTGGNYGFYLSGQSYVTVNGFTITGTTNQGIYAKNSSQLTISNNHVTYAGTPVQGSTSQGIALNNTSSSLVSGNTADHNSDAGIALTNGSTADEVRGNVTFANARQWQRAAPGIRLYSAPGNTVDGNVTHDNEDSGIESYSNSNGTVIYNNVSYGNGDHGIDDNRCVGQQILSNTVYDNATAGINLEGGSTGGTVVDNISVDNGIVSPRTRGDIRVERGSTSGTTVDWNLVYLTQPDTLLIWDSVNYTTLSSYQAASGQMLHGIVADPRWQNASAGDFQLSPGSPAIDSGDSAVANEPALDANGKARIDDPATPNTGTGPRTYDDLGAYEYQPVANPLVPALQVTPNAGQAPLDVTADASGSTDTAATITSYSFDFGDGTTTGPQAAPTADHSYQDAGVYTVAVTVADNGGNSAVTTRQVTVTAGEQGIVGNPGFEADLAGWKASGSGITLTQVAGGHESDFAAALTNTRNVATGCTLNDSPNWVADTVAGTYTGTMWVRADDVGRTLSLRFREYSGKRLVSSAWATVTLSTAWQLVSVTHQVATAGTTLDFNAYTSTKNSPPGVCFYADDASITVG